LNKEVPDRKIKNNEPAEAAIPVIGEDLGWTGTRLKIL
jgi:hypothetical protein